MDSREQELAALEAAALRTESLERVAEQCFDDRHAAAEREGALASVKDTPEFRDWMAARAETDAAWGRWAECMDTTRPC